MLMEGILVLMEPYMCQKKKQNTMRERDLLNK